MKLQVTYCKGWRKGFENWTEIWTKDKAIKMFNKGKPVGVILGESDAPKYYLDVTLNMVAVDFLDKLKRSHTVHIFSKCKNDDKMFLEQVISREYFGDTDEVSAGEHFIFDETGEVHIHRSKYKPNYSETADTKADVTDCYEDILVFGEYDPFLRFERNVFQLKKAV
jgi:hypothetical protein